MGRHVAGWYPLVPPPSSGAQAGGAEELVIGSKTKATPIQHVLSKLGVNTLAQAVSVAFSAGPSRSTRAHALALLDA
jgi:hypothetical protein